MAKREITLSMREIAEEVSRLITSETSHISNVPLDEEIGVEELLLELDRVVQLAQKNLKDKKIEQGKRKITFIPKNKATDHGKRQSADR